MNSFQRTRQRPVGANKAAPPLLICGAGGRWRFYATAWDMTCEQNLTVKHGKIEGKDFQTVHPL